MTGDKSKFITLDEKKSGNVTFGNDKPGKIKGKGSVSIDNGRGKVQDVLFVDGLKENLLSVSQMCDKGCEVLFRAQDYEVISSTIGKTQLKGVRTESNVYIVKEEDEACHLSKLEESWLWHRRLEHLSFDHIIRLSKKKAVRDMPEIKRPSNTICKSCQLGKETRTSFQSKDEISTRRPLQLVHMDLCGPARTKKPSGESYFMLIIDDFSRMTWVAFLKKKS